MKQLFLFIFLLASLAIYAEGEQTSGLQQATEQQAEELYRNGNFKEAAAIYNRLLDEKGESAQIYYNLGNTFYKMNEIGAAILNYERALLFSPSDRDILFNLELAHSKTVDQLNVSDSFLLKRFWNDIENIMSEKGWGSMAIFLFLLFIASLFLFFFGKRLSMKKISFYAGCTAFVLIIFCNTFAHEQRKKIEHRNKAIVMAATVTVKSSPDKSGTDLFVLHEGSKVTVKNSISAWSEIELPDGSVGWMESDKLEKI